MILVPPLILDSSLQTDASQWRIVFYLTAFIYFIGNLVFIIFGRTSVQRWNNPQQIPRSTHAREEEDHNVDEAERARLIDS